MALGMFQLPAERLDAVATESEKATDPGLRGSRAAAVGDARGLHDRRSRPGCGTGADTVQAGARSQGRAVDRRGLGAGRRRPQRAAARHARRDRRWRPAPSPWETGVDGPFHRRRSGCAGPDHGARPRPDRALPGLPLCRLAGAQGAARSLPAGRAHRRYRADVARRDRGGDASAPRTRARTWRACIRAICRSGVRWASSFGVSTRRASPTP